MRIRIFKFLKRILLGNEISLALTVLQLIARSMGKTSPNDLSSFVFQQLPKRWKDPSGPATEMEFLQMISSGVEFYRSVRRVVT